MAESKGGGKHAGEPKDKPLKVQPPTKSTGDTQNTGGGTRRK